jgi:hypothetical protein
MGALVGAASSLATHSYSSNSSRAQSHLCIMGDEVVFNKYYSRFKLTTVEIFEQTPVNQQRF